MRSDLYCLGGQKYEVFFRVGIMETWVVTGSRSFHLDHLSQPVNLD